VATGACTSCDGLWRGGKWCYSQDCVDRRVQGVVPAASLIQDVGFLTVSVNTATGLPPTRSCIVFSLRDRTW
jgi:hypothetical protein